MGIDEKFEIEFESSEPEQDQGTGLFKLPNLEHTVHNTVLGFKKALKFKSFYSLYTQVIDAVGTNYSNLADSSIEVNVDNIVLLDHEAIAHFYSDKKNRKKKVLHYRIKLSTENNDMHVWLRNTVKKASYGYVANTKCSIISVHPRKEYYSYQEVKKYNNLCDALRSL